MKYVSATMFAVDCIFPFATRHDYCFTVSTGLHCFLQQNHSPNFLHVSRSLKNHSCSYTIPHDVQIIIIITIIIIIILGLGPFQDN
jgi:hypothetical protein